MTDQEFEHVVASLAQADVVAILMRYRRALQGIGSCATQCGCCEMHVRVAKQALNWQLSRFCAAGPLTEEDGLTPERRAAMNRQCEECET
jgi:hypothetical protein